MVRGTLSAIAAWVALAAVTAFGAGPAAAETVQRTGVFGGLEITYRVALPDGYDPALEYPTILHFAGGPQSLEIVTRSLESDWAAGAAARGFVVVAPAAPDAGLFFQGGDAAFPDFLDFVFDEFRVAGGRLHATGHSNGGISAFHIASLYPDAFVSVTGYPGYLAADTPERVAALDGMCLFMHVGDQDPSWLAAMTDQAEAFAAGGMPVTLTVEPGQIHRLDVSRDGLSDRLFAEIESAATGCR